MILRGATIVSLRWMILRGICDNVVRRQIYINEFYITRFIQGDRKGQIFIKLNRLRCDGLITRDGGEYVSKIS